MELFGKFESDATLFEVLPGDPAFTYGRKRAGFHSDRVTRENPKELVAHWRLRNPYYLPKEAHHKAFRHSTRLDHADLVYRTVQLKRLLGIQ
jgi:hypothetical protein